MEGTRLEENAEMENALAAYQKVLNVDPGQAELALRVAALLSRQEDFPRAIDVLKDAIKANPKEAAPYLQLSFIYAKYLKKTDQALKYANQAIALDPQNFDAYQRLYEIEADRRATRKKRFRRWNARPTSRATIPRSGSGSANSTPRWFSKRRPNRSRKTSNASTIFSESRRARRR